MQQRVASIPRLAAQPHLRPGHSFFPFYIAHCTRKLLLLLDPRRRGSVLPHDVLQPRALRLQPRISRHARAAEVSVAAEPARLHGGAARGHVRRDGFLLAYAAALASRTAPLPATPWLQAATIAHASQAATLCILGGSRCWATR